MKQPDTFADEDLILHYYGEADSPETIEAALADSEDLRHRFAELERLLDAVEPNEPPERSDLYGHEVWKKVYPQLETRRWSQWPKVAGWAIAASLLIMVSFWAGRESAPITPKEQVAMSQAARNRILLAAVADHLERSQFLLLELANANGGTFDSNGVETATELKDASRLYRQAAQNSGEGQVVALLDELERFLTELANSGVGTDTDLDALVRRIEDRNLIFKVRVLGSQLDERARVEDDGATI